MMITKIFINICRDHLRSGDRFDHGGRAACTVSSGKYTRHVLKGSGAGGDNLAAGYRNSGVLEMFRLNILADRNDQNVAWDIDILFSGRPDACASVSDRAYHLRSHIDAFYMIILVYVNGSRGF